jgi:hypothetical protein
MPPFVVIVEQDSGLHNDNRIVTSSGDWSRAFVGTLTRHETNRQRGRGYADELPGALDHALQIVYSLHSWISYPTSAFSSSITPSVTKMLLPVCNALINLRAKNLIQLSTLQPSVRRFITELVPKRTLLLPAPLPQRRSRSRLLRHHSIAMIPQFVLSNQFVQLLRKSTPYKTTPDVELRMLGP